MDIALKKSIQTAEEINDFGVSGQAQRCWLAQRQILSWITPVNNRLSQIKIKDQNLTEKYILYSYVYQKYKYQIYKKQLKFLTGKFITLKFSDLANLYTMWLLT